MSFYFLFVSKKKYICLCVLSVFDLSMLARWEHCYQDEDLMKEYGRIASKTHPATMEAVSMERYLAWFEFCIFK